MKFSEVLFEEMNWDRLISRQEQLYSRPDDIRTEFSRDYNRILHSTAYRRLKHKRKFSLQLVMITYVQEWSMSIMFHPLAIRFVGIWGLTQNLLLQ